MVDNNMTVALDSNYLYNVSSVAFIPDGDQILNLIKPEESNCSVINLTEEQVNSLVQHFGNEFTPEACSSLTGHVVKDKTVMLSNVENNILPISVQDKNTLTAHVVAIKQSENVVENNVDRVQHVPSNEQRVIVPSVESNSINVLSRSVQNKDVIGAHKKRVTKKKCTSLGENSMQKLAVKDQRVIIHSIENNANIILPSGLLNRNPPINNVSVQQCGGFLKNLVQQQLPINHQTVTNTESNPKIILPPSLHGKTGNTIDLSKNDNRTITTVEKNSIIPQSVQNKITLPINSAMVQNNLLKNNSPQSLSNEDNKTSFNNNVVYRILHPEELRLTVPEYKKCGRRRKLVDVSTKDVEAQQKEKLNEEDINLKSVRTRSGRVTKLPKRMNEVENDIIKKRGLEENETEKEKDQVPSITKKLKKRKLKKTEKTKSVIERPIPLFPKITLSEKPVPLRPKILKAKPVHPKPFLAKPIAIDSFPVETSCSSASHTEVNVFQISPLPTNIRQPDTLQINKNPEVVINYELSNDTQKIPFLSNGTKLQEIELDSNVQNGNSVESKTDQSITSWKKRRNSKSRRTLVNTENLSLPERKRKVSSNLVEHRCSTCNKLYLGKTRMEKHLLLNPDHKAPNRDPKAVLWTHLLKQTKSAFKTEKATVFLNELSDILYKLRKVASLVLKPITKDVNTHHDLDNVLAMAFGVPEGKYEVDIEPLYKEQSYSESQNCDSFESDNSAQTSLLNLLDTGQVSFDSAESGVTSEAVMCVDQLVNERLKTLTDAELQPPINPSQNLTLDLSLDMFSYPT